jgi:SAM-dependent methyltransferase
MIVNDIARRVGYRFPPTRHILRARALRNARAHNEIMERDRLLDFWRSPEPEGNVPAQYLDAPGRSRVLVELLEAVPKSSRILEVGCNVGRNLAHLTDCGYTRLEGVEISPHAVELLRESYPQLAETPIHLGSAEEVLPRLDGYDLVFTMAVLEHIHPDSSAVFDEIARLGRTVLTIEPAPGHIHSSSRQFPHDLSAVFESGGMKLISTIPLAKHPMVAGDPLAGYAAWRFEHV